MCEALPPILKRYMGPSPTAHAALESSCLPTLSLSNLRAEPIFSEGTNMHQPTTQPCARSGLSCMWTLRQFTGQLGYGQLKFLASRRDTFFVLLVIRDPETLRASYRQRSTCILSARTKAPLLGTRLTRQGILGFQLGSEVLRFSNSPPQLLPAKHQQAKAVQGSG